mmetsp:Transcript_150396/g.483319  ORF Transcript_150396/g.483319 Transcript_150396/m.483319 type:complete len:206 (-) Transcript_150396:2290-2907(-)
MAAASDETPEEALDDATCPAHHADPAPGSDAAERCLELGQVLDHQQVLLACEPAPPDTLKFGNPKLQLSLVFLGLELAVPTLENCRVLASVSMHFQHIQHQLGLLKDEDGLRLPLDGLAREDAAEKTLEHGEGLLLLRLRQDVTGIVTEGVCRKVVIVAFDAGCKPRRLRALEEPMPLGRLPQRGLEGVRVEVEPGVAVPRTILV